MLRRVDLSISLVRVAVSSSVTARPSGGSMYVGSMLGGSGTGRLPVGVMKSMA
jgi:hypothetical protein